MLRTPPGGFETVAGALHVAGAALAQVRAHAAAAYPEECCGALLGLDVDVGAHGIGRVVTRAVAVENRWAGRRESRFLIPAGDVRALEAQAARSGLSLVGFYHSHPDGRTEPSRRDRAQAWPWYSYLIVAVSAGGAGQARSWRLADDRHAFLPEDLAPEDLAAEDEEEG
ncbi:MAG TPA: M67 family metallopeptidase [Longimicrobium sp.]|nr:M67 family metallopeptidase [Longimicrobium sp.]